MASSSTVWGSAAVTAAPAHDATSTAARLATIRLVARYAASRLGMPPDSEFPARVRLPQCLSTWRVPMYSRPDSDVSYTVSSSLWRAAPSFSTDSATKLSACSHCSCTYCPSVTPSFEPPAATGFAAALRSRDRRHLAALHSNSMRRPASQDRFHTSCSTGLGARSTASAGHPPRPYRCNITSSASCTPSSYGSRARAGTVASSASPVCDARPSTSSCAADGFSNSGGAGNDTPSSSEATRASGSGADCVASAWPLAAGVTPLPPHANSGDVSHRRTDVSAWDHTVCPSAVRTQRLQAYATKAARRASHVASLPASPPPPPLPTMTAQASSRVSRR